MKRKMSVLLCLVLLAVTCFGGSMCTYGASLVSGSYVKGDNENNPLVTQNYGADPWVMVYNNTVYVYTTNDSQEFTGSNENTYSKINTLNCYSSTDMVNWTDHGTINVAGSNGAAKWASNSWAPCVTYKTINGKVKFFLYFANNASSIGVLTADSPTGPWSDPIGKALVTKSTAGCSGVTWMFDPAVLVDSDGTGYLYFGGGIPSNNYANPKTARVIKLGSNMISTTGTAATIDAPYLFEDSGINKIGNTYYYSYCSNWNCSNGYNNAAIEYMTSSSPMGPFTYKGEVMKNPGVFFSGSTGNNHHCIFEFKGSYYMAYHTRTVESKVIGKSLGYRTTQIDKISVSNGKINSLTPSLSGVSQTSYVNPYNTVEAETIFTQAGIAVKASNTSGSAYVTSISYGDYTKVKGVNFSNGLKSLSVKVKASASGSLEVRESSPSGTLLGTISISNTNGSYKDFSANMTSVSGVKNICFVFKGSYDFDSWKASATSSASSGSSSSSSSSSSSTSSANTNTNSTAKIADGWYYLKNTNSQKYLTVEGNKAAAGTNVCISTGTGVDGQKWYVTNTSDGYITLTSKLGSFMLDVANGSADDGANIGIYHGYSGDAQKFVVKNTSTSGVYTIATKSSNQVRYIDVYNHGKTDGTNVCQWLYYGNPNQQWQFEKIASSSSSSSSSSSGSTANTGSSSSSSSSSSSGSSSSSSSTASTGMKLDYTINNWGSGYQVSFKVTNNTGKQVNTWTLKLKKSDINITSSWNVNVTTSGDYYVITPVSWNSTIANGSSIEFGAQGSGSIGSTIGYTFQ